MKKPKEIEMATMTPEQQALKVLHEVVESIKLTGPERDTVRRAVATIQKAIMPEAQPTKDASDIETKEGG